MRIVLVLKMIQLVLSVICLGLLLKSKDLCAFKKAENLPVDQLACHSSLIQTTFNSSNPIDFKLKGCIRVDEMDIYTSQLKPLNLILLPVCLLVCELFLLALQMAKIASSCQIPDQISTFLNNIIHAICWITSAAALRFLQVKWNKEWKDLSPEFIPVYPIEYIWVEGIVWYNILVLLLESTIFQTAIYYDLKMEGRKEPIPTYIRSEFKENLLEENH